MFYGLVVHSFQINFLNNLVGNAISIRHQLAWMADFVESVEHELQTILHNLSAAQHGKGPADFEAGL